MKKIFIGIFFAIFFCVSWTHAETLSYIPKNPERALILIHGYGGDGQRLSWMTEPLKKAIPNMAFYYPTAPDVSPFGGYQWFVVPFTGEQIREKTLYDKMMKDAMKNVSKLHDLVEKIHRDLRLAYENIYVAGFSQGGLMALLTTLTSHRPLSVAVSLSGVPLLFGDDFRVSDVHNYPDILLIQGTADQVVPQDSLKISEETLTSLKIKPQIRKINGMGHQINAEVINYLIEFIE